MITSFKIFENHNWNEVLHAATWTGKSIGTKKRGNLRDTFYYMDFDKIKLAIENGADVDSCDTLGWAVRMNRFEIVKYMLEHGANPDKSIDSGEWTPLMCAADDGYVDIAKILIDYNADPFQGNFQDTTTMDIITPKSKTSDAPFGYERQKKELQKNRDEIREYIEKSVHVAARRYNL